MPNEVLLFVLADTRVSDPIPAADDMLALVERLEAGLIARVTDRREEISEDEYKRIRRILLQHPHLGDVLPAFVKNCRTTDDIWHYISTTSELPSGGGVWQGRRSFIRQSLGSIVDLLEQENIDLLGPYEQVQLLGRGGFGEVYEYRHRQTHELFAIKFFHPAFSRGGEVGFLERFLREARILQRIRHSNIIGVYESGQYGRRPFIRMERFHGRDLGRRLREYGIFSPELALQVIYALVAGLDHAHTLGIVHRDLKPTNVMTAHPGQLRIIDFGLGCFVEDELISRLTRTGEALVGGHYTAPELISNPRLLDTRSDLYSVGAIWYELILGRPPAGSRIAEALHGSGAIAAEQEIILRCLADADHRYPSAAALITDLEAVGGGRPTM